MQSLLSREGTRSAQIDVSLTPLEVRSRRRSWTGAVGFSIRTNLLIYVNPRKRDKTYLSHDEINPRGAAAKFKPSVAVTLPKSSPILRLALRPRVRGRPFLAFVSIVPRVTLGAVMRAKKKLSSGGRFFRSRNRFSISEVLTLCFPCR